MSSFGIAIVSFGNGPYPTFVVQIDVIVWIHDMACGVASTLFIAGLW
jgi:hypothetical protein